MGKVEVPWIFSTIYTDPSKNDCLQKEAIIRGEPGKQIRLEELGLNLQVTKAGITGTVWVTANGEEVARWTENKTTYQPKSALLSALASDGEDVLLRWYIKTSDRLYRSRMTALTYTYSLIDIPDPVPDSQAVVWVAGVTKTQAEELVTALKVDYPGIEAYIKI